MQEPPYAPPPNCENATLLVALDRAARQQDWPSRAAFYRSIEDSVLLVPVAELSAGVTVGDTISNDSVDLMVGYGIKPTGEKWTAVYTDEDALRSVAPTQPFVRIGARALFKMMLELGMDEIIINLFEEQPTRPGKVLTRAEFEMLATDLAPVEGGDHHFEARVGEGSVPVIEPPVDPLPDAVVGALRSAAEPLRGLASIHHFRLAFAGGPPHEALGLCCGVGPSPLPIDQVVERLMSQIQPLLDPRASLDIIPIDTDNHEAFQKGRVVWQRSGS